MKKVFLLLLIALTLLALPAVKSYAAVKQDTTSTAPPDDIVFTEVGSAQDSAANKIVKDSVKKETKAAGLTTAEKSAKGTSTEGSEKLTLWQTFIKGLFGGFLAFLMPCIFPMVPLTISYFTKKAGSRKKGIGQAIIYGISIIVIYVVFGLLITVLFGSSKLNELSSSGWFNFAFFILLIVFAISFFGAFEITLPSSFVNKIDQKADTSKGLGGIFFMAASLALVS
ncbi:MAG: hypothetical protein EOO96_06840, partial [Pedobacter sp.]